MFDIVTKPEARLLGLSTYFTGKSCPAGHVSYRYTSNGKCSECAKAWNKENADVTREAVNKYHAKNKDKINAAKRSAFAKNREVVNAKKRKTYHADPTKSRERNRDWYIRNAELNRAKVRARNKHMKHATPPWVNKAELLEIYINCPAGYQVDHFVPVRGITPDGRRVSGLHVPWNLRYLPAALNAGRSNRLTNEDLQEIEADTLRRFHAAYGSIFGTAA